MVQIKKSEDVPEPDTILAEWILDISNSMSKLESSGLNKKAIIVLVHDDCKVSKKVIAQVLNSLESLRQNYCVK